MMRKTNRWNAIAVITAITVGLVAIGADAQRSARDERRQQRQEERRDDARDDHVEATTDWSKLGERWVEPGVSTDVISVTAMEGRFTRALIKVEHGALELRDVVFTFGDGTTFSPSTRLRFGPGATTREIALPDGPRVIRRVDFRVANRAREDRAQFELWAR